MPHSFNKIWIHAIWATKERAGCSSPLEKKNPVRHVWGGRIFFTHLARAKSSQLCLIGFGCGLFPGMKVITTSSKPKQPLGEVTLT